MKLKNIIGSTAAKWAACLLATVCIGGAWGAPVVTFLLRDEVGDMTIQYDSSVYTLYTQEGVERSGAAVYNYMTQTVANGDSATEPTGEPSYWYHSGKTFPVGNNTGIPFTVEQSQAYVFDGWRLSGETERYDFSTPVTSDITLVPHFSAVDAVFEIYTEADLLAFAREVALGRSYRSKWGGFPRQTVKLMNNITLTSNWTPIPGNFRGIFDGNGYAISGLVINDTNNETGFFRTSGNGGSSFEIKDLTFQNPQVTSSGCHVGVLAGKMDSATISNVTINNPTVLCTSTDNVGGLVGSVNNNVDDDPASASVFSGCSVNGGTISCTGSDGRMVGGLIGQAVRYLTVTDCSVTDVTINGYRKLGGLIGQANGTHLTCTDASVSGVTLNALGDTSYAKDLTMGGLVGQFATPTQSTITGTVSDLTMTGPESIASGKNYVMGWVSGGTGGTLETAETAMTSASMTFDVAVSGTNTRTISNDSTYAGINGATVTVQKYFYQDAEDANLWHIANLDGLIDFRKSVNNKTTYSGKTIQLDADIDMTGVAWLPIGGGTTEDVDTSETWQNYYFAGTFDGQNHVISNLTVALTKEDSRTSNRVGLFGFVNGGTVKDLVIENVDLTGGWHVAPVAGRGDGATFSGITVRGIVNVDAVGNVSGLVGNAYTGNVRNCVVNGTLDISGEESDTSGIAGYGYADISDCVVVGVGNSVISGGEFTGGIKGYSGEGNVKVERCSVSNVTVVATSCGAGGVLGCLHYGNRVIDCNVYDVTVVGNKPINSGVIGLIAGAGLGTVSDPSFIYGCSVSNSTATVNGMQTFSLCGDMNWDGESNGNGYVYFNSDKTSAVNNNTIALTNGTYTASPETAVAGKTAVSVGYAAKSYVAEGYAVTANGNGTWTIGTLLPVATIDDTPYYSLAEAVAAAYEWDEIVLLADITLDSTLVLDKSLYIYGAEEDETPHKLTGTVKVVADPEVDVQVEIYNLVFGTGSTIDVSEKGNSYFEAEDDDAASLSFENVAVEDGSTLTIVAGVLDGRKILIDDGVGNDLMASFTADLPSCYELFLTYDGGGLHAVKYVASVILPTGNKKFESIETAIQNANYYGVDEITILDAGAVASAPEGWKIADGKLVRKVYVAQVVGGQSYETIAEAIAAASEGGTVQVLVNCSIDAHIDVTKNLTLDLNGKTVVNKVQTARAFDVITYGKTLTVRGNGGGMTIDPGVTSYGFFRLQEAKTGLVLDGGAYSGSLGSACFFRFNSYGQSMILSNVTANVTGGGGVVYPGSGYKSPNNNHIEVEGGSFSTSGTTAVDSEVFRLVWMSGHIRNATIVSSIDSTWYNGGIHVQGNLGQTFEIDNCAITNTVVAHDGDHNRWASCVTAAGATTVKITNCDMYSAQYGVYVFSSGATVELEDSNLKADYKALYSQLAVNGKNGDNAISSGIIKVKSGLVDGTIRAEYWDFDTSQYVDFYAAGLQIEGGKFKNFVVECPDSPNTIMAISGGVFDNPVIQRFCAENYEPADNTDALTKDEYPYTVVLKGVAKIADNYYQTLADAVAAAENGDTVTLLIDVEEPFALGKDVSITLNLNGNAISVDSGNAISATAGELTVTSVVDDEGYATGGVVGAVSVSEGASLNLTGGIYDVDWDDCNIEGTIAVSSVNRFYDWDPTEVEAASAVFTSPVPYEYCATGFIPGAYDDIYIDGDYYYYVKEGSFLWRVADIDGKVAYTEVTPDSDDDEDWWEYDWFGEHEMNRNGFTMTLLHDVPADDDDFSAYVSGVTYTIDLGGHTVNQQMSFGVGKCYVTITNGVVRNAEGTGVSVDNGAQVTFGDGFVVAQSVTGVYVDGGTEGDEYSKLTVTDGAVVNGACGVLVFGSGSENPVTEVVVAGGEINGTLYGISGNGTIEGDDDYSNTRISISGGMVKGGDMGIYHPQAGELSVSGGAITGGTAIYAKSGTISVTGGELSANGASGQYDVSYAEDGPQQTGDAFVVDSANYPGGNPTATISGGTFTSLNGNGVASYAITGQATVSNFVSGGYFSQYVTDIYCASGYLCTTRPVKDELYQVVPAATVTYTMGENPPTGAALPDPASFAYPSGDMAEIALTNATCTADGYTFAGWKIGGAGDALGALPARTTGDITLVATWTGAKVIEINAGGANPTEIKVTDAWLEANGLADEDDEDVIKAALEATPDGSDKPAWQSYVLGQTPTAELTADVEQGSVSAMPVTSSAQVPAVDTGFKVEYRLDKVTEAGATVTEGTVQPTDTIPLDLTTMTGNVEYYKTTAVITSTDPNSHVEVEVPSTNTIGVLKVESAPATAIIGVPWSSSTDSTSISVDELVRTANLTPGDELKVYDPVTKKYKMWTLNDDKEWEPVETSSGSGTSDPGEATDSSVARGAGVWLTRQNPDEPIYLVGQAEASITETAIDRPTAEEAEAGEKVWNLVASPNATTVTAADILATKSPEDKIIIPTKGSPKNISWNAKKGKWGYVDYETDPATGYSVPVFVEATEAEIPAGTGFWYLNGDSNEDKITW